MSNLLLVVSFILMPFIFKILQVLKDQKQELKEMDEKYEQSKRRMNSETQF